MHRHPTRILLLSRSFRRSPCHNRLPRHAAQPVNRSPSTPVRTAVTIANSATRDQDHETLRRVFDSPNFWREFSNDQQSVLSGKRAGLLQNQYLTSPAGFERFAQETLGKCEAITAEVINASTTEELCGVAKAVDRLSDLLCRVMDSASFICGNHPDAVYQDAAGRAHAMMFEYMNILNTTPALYEQLKRAASDPEISAGWSEEEKMTADILISDFAKSGIHLPPEKRQRYVTLSNEINDAGMDFVRNPYAMKSHLKFPTKRLNGLDPLLLNDIRRFGSAVVPMSGTIPATVMTTVHDEEVRKEVYIAQRTASASQVRKLEVLLRKRAEIAKLTGFETYAHMTLSDKMAGNPDAVKNFLWALHSQNKASVDDYLDKLMAIKGASYGIARFHAWDQAYFLHQYKLRNPRMFASRALGVLAPYFSLGTVMEGLSRLFNQLYGVRFVPRQTLAGETWHEDVRSLDVLDENNQRIAVLYCDLFHRTGKHTIPTHFTLRCSREISPSEMAEAQASGHHPNDGMAMGRKDGSSNAYQLPVVALICQFSQPSSTQPNLLSEQEVTTLFHEMGHAIHSILGRTDFQTISGTRCATDFAELPSVLNESFAFTPSVLALYARNYQTGQPISPELINAVHSHKNSRNALSGPSLNEYQILAAMLDHAYHTLPPDSSFNSTKIYHDIYTRFSSLPDPPESGTSWQGYFTHIFTYGATYYSYLFDRAIAQRLFAGVFGDGERALDRESGERFRNEVLKWGGGRNGWKCVAGALGEVPETSSGKLQDGGEEAMRTVGLWGVGNPTDE